MRGRSWSKLLLPAVLALAATSCTSATTGADRVTSPTASEPVRSTSSAPAVTAATSSPRPPASAATETIATTMSVPWGVAFLPDRSALVTLRDEADVIHVARPATPITAGVVPGVAPGGEGGLLGIAVSPTFAADRAVFVYFTSENDNRVMRMTFDGRRLTPGAIIIEGIPKAGNHNGGRLAFGPDGFLYVSTGDAAQNENAQDMSSLGGKILRVTTNGAPAPGNPFPGSRVWTLGHRNVQGLAWDKAGTMYASEFGQNTWDELNHIEPGRNYGWPEVEGIGNRSGFVDPLFQWPTTDASPSGIAVGADGAIYMAALRGESLWRIPLKGAGRVGTPERLLEGRYGRLRAAVTAPDGRLWVVTNNTSRGDPKPGDDRIIAFRLPVQQ